MFIIPQGSTITINGKVYRTLEAQVAWNTEQLQSMDVETLQNLPAAFAALSDDVDDLSDDLVAVSGQVTTNTDDILDLKGTVSGTGGITDQIHIINDNIENLLLDMGNAQDDIDDLEDAVADKLDAPSSPGNLGDVLVLGSGDLPEWQAAAPFNPNGTYPGVTVGTATVAKNIENVSEDSGSDQTEPFFFQATATENNTGSTPTAPQFELKNLRGNTIVYNQLVDGVNLTYATISGHKYWVYVSATDYTSIVTSSGSPTTVSDAQKDKIVDLTRWFNGSIPSAITDDPTVFPINYYDDDLTYSAGELKNCSCTELKTVGFNLFDKSTATDGKYIGSSGAIYTDATMCYSDYIRIPNGQKVYYNFLEVTSVFKAICYDKDKNVIGGNSTGTLIAGTVYIRLNMKIADKDTACCNLSWDGERDGEYSPYISHTYPMVWSGKSAGSAYDEKLPDGTDTTRIGSVDMGSLNWTYNDTEYDYGYFQSDAISGKAMNKNMICSKYPNLNHVRSNIGNYEIGLRNATSDANKIVVRDSNFTDAAAFKTAMSGVTLYYELATPTTSSGDAFTSVIEGDDYGTMAFDSVVPVGNEFFYPADYALLIDDLNNYVNGDVTELAKMSDIPSVVVPDPPTVDGNYTLKCDVTGGSPSLYWD